MSSLNSCPCQNCQPGGSNFVQPYSPNTIPESCNLNAFDPNMPCSEIRTTNLNQQPPINNKSLVKCLNDKSHIEKSYYFPK